MQRKNLGRDQDHILKKKDLDHILATKKLLYISIYIVKYTKVSSAK